VAIHRLVWHPRPGELQLCRSGPALPLTLSHANCNRAESTRSLLIRFSRLRCARVCSVPDNRAVPAGAARSGRLHYLVSRQLANILQCVAANCGPLRVV
jgi:hypothetical protein